MFYCFGPSRIDKAVKGKSYQRRWLKGDLYNSQNYRLKKKQVFLLRNLILIFRNFFTAFTIYTIKEKAGVFAPAFSPCCYTGITTTIYYSLMNFRCSLVPPPSTVKMYTPAFSVLTSAW